MNNLGHGVDFSAPHKTQTMVGRVDILEKIKHTIYPNDNIFRVVFIRAAGGMGKTRLLEEVLDKVDNGWANLGNTVVSELVDVIDMRLHQRERFVQALRNSLRRPGGVDFRAYDRARARLEQQIAVGAQLSELDVISEEVLKLFIQDLKKITQTCRIVWVIDTVEQLRYETSQWLFERNLLHPNDLRKRTHQWLQDFIQKADIQNVTFLLAGRGNEGERFFANISSAINQATKNDHKCKLVDNINLSRLSPLETRSYFAYLAEGQYQRGNSGNAQIFEHIASEKNERADVLWLYTGGIPIRLALYAQIIVDGYEIPKSLRLSWEEAKKRAKTDDPTILTDELRQMQWEIEDQFINLLFQNPTDIRTRILQTLVRAPRGLNAVQLHYILDNENSLTPEDWRGEPERLHEITNLLNEMTDYYLVKKRSSWEDLPTLEEPKDQATTLRLGLQDEVYRIFAEHMAPHAEPTDPNIDAIFAQLNEIEQERYRQNHNDEQKARKDLYIQLRSWATFQLQQYLQKKQQNMLNDERGIERQLVPDQRRTFHFPTLGQDDVKKRAALNGAINTFTVEQMVYDLLLDPEGNLNASYVDLGTSSIKANEFGFDYWAQGEMWRIVHDDYSLKFNNLREREAALQYDENMIAVLRRAVIQEDVSRWLKRMVILGDYERAREFARDTDKIIKDLPRKTKYQQRVWHSWNHTLVQAERGIWACYARIYLSEEMDITLSEIEDHIKTLLLLIQYTVAEVAITRQDGYKEKGFLPVNEATPAHPALLRARRLVSLAYNILGYGSIMYGRTHDAIYNYSRALHYIRGDRAVDSHRAVVLNNLSRALSEMGRPGSLSVCRDGLNLRRQLAEEVPLAFSYNTLALIYDDLGRYEDAPLLAAKAIAYFQRAGEIRGLGLASLQLGESLRHLAVRARRGEMMLATPDSLYTTAQDLLVEAHNLFEVSSEIARRIGLKIELGSLYRDQLDISEVKQANQYQEALIYLTEAKKLAEKHSLPHLATDAGVNLALTHFIVGKEIEALDAVNQTEKSIDLSVKNEAGEGIADFSWALRQLSRIQMIRGWIALNRFQQRSKHFDYIEAKNERHIAISNDEKAQNHLKEAATAYTNSLSQAESFSPQSHLVQTLSDDFYNRVKSLSQQALDDLYVHIKNLQEKCQNSHRLDVFLDESLGVSKSLLRSRAEIN